jgi:hypothetical protein
MRAIGGERRIGESDDVLKTRLEMATVVPGLTGGVLGDLLKRRYP